MLEVLTALANSPDSWCSVICFISTSVVDADHLLFISNKRNSTSVKEAGGHVRIGQENHYSKVQDRWYILLLVATDILHRITYDSSIQDEQVYVSIPKGKLWLAPIGLVQ